MNKTSKGRDKALVLDIIGGVEKYEIRRDKLKLDLVQTQKTNTR